MGHLIFVVTLLCALCTALQAGTFFAFSVFYMRALGGLSAERGIVAMQATVLAIKRLPFLILFFGTAVLSAISAILALLHWGEPGACAALAGAVLFLLGPFAITLLRSVPLNNMLLAARPDEDDAREFWARFKTAWVRWNHVRTVTGVLSCASFMLALAAIGNPFGTG